MLDGLKEHLGRVITMVQEKYGELTEDEVNQVQDEPNRLYEILESKFGVSRQESEAFISNKLQSISGAVDGLNNTNEDVDSTANPNANSVDNLTAGAKDAATGLFGGSNDITNNTK